MDVQKTLAMTLEISLSKRQHAKFVAAIEKLYAEMQARVSDSEDYTFCFLTCAGRATL